MHKDDLNKAKELSAKLASLGMKGKPIPKKVKSPQPKNLEFLNRLTGVVAKQPKEEKVPEPVKVVALPDPTPEILAKVLSELADKLPTAESIVEEIKTGKLLDISNIRNGENLAYLAQSHRNQNKKEDMTDMRWHGGGLSSVAHDATLTGNGTTDSPLSVVGGGTGTVTDVSVVTANGFYGTVATSTTTPAITLGTSVTGIIKGNGIAISAASAGTDYEVPLTFSTGLTRATNTITSNISTGIAGSQTIYGGTAANEDLTIQGTSNATKTTSYVNIQPTGGFVGIGMTTPGSRLSFGTTIEEKIRLFDSGTAGGSYGIGTTSSCTQIFSGSTGDIAISRGGNAGTQIARWVGATDFMALGTITPVAKLHLDSGNATASAIKLTAGTTTGVTSTDGINFGITTAGVGEIRQYENQVINIYTNNTLAATFTTGQDLQVVSAGTTATSVATLAATQTLTNKTLTSPSIASPTITTEWDFGAHTAGFTETDNGNSSTADTIDWRVSNKQKSTLTGNVTYTFTAPTKPCNLLLKVLTGAGSFTATWPATVKWSGGTAPTITTTASRADIITFYYDGTNYYGSYIQNFTP